MKKKYNTHKLDKSGARYYVEEMQDGKRSYWMGTVCRDGRRWRFKAGTKEAAEEKVEQWLVQLRNEGGEVVEMSSAGKRDAVKARRFLLDGETLPEAAELLREVRRLLGMMDERADVDTDDEDAVRRAVAANHDEVKRAIVEMVEARAALDGRATLPDAARFWAKHHPSGEAVTLKALAEAYMEAKSRKRPSYFKNVKSKCGQFVEFVGGNVPVASIMPDRLAKFMATRGEATATRKAWRTFLLGLFGLAVSRKWLGDNPASELDKIEDEDPSDDVEFYAVEDVEKLLRAAERVAPSYAPALALLFFAGVRPHELTGSYTVRKDGEDEGTGQVIGGLDWRFVGVNGEVVVTRSTSKTKRYRRIPMSDNLRAWLTRYGGERKGRLIPNPQAWRRARERIVAAAGVAWMQDAPRHSFASYHWAKHQNRGELEAAMGHTGDTNTLEKFYTTYVDRKDAERFWSLLPTGMSSKKAKAATSKKRKGKA